MRKKLLIVPIILVAVLVILLVKGNKPQSPAYVLMSDIIETIGADVKLEETSVGWNIGRYQTIDGKMMRLYRKGYTFSHELTAEENSKIFETWNNTETIDPLSISSLFEKELVGRGFKNDLNNANDDEISSVSGYILGSIGCVIRREVIVDDPKDIVEGQSYPTETTISCADNVLWEGNSTTTEVI